MRNVVHNQSASIFLFPMFLRPMSLQGLMEGSGLRGGRAGGVRAIMKVS